MELLKRKLISSALLAVFFSCILAAVGLAMQAGQSSFAVSPYLQLGTSSDATKLSICWAVKGIGDYRLEFKQGDAGSFQTAQAAEQGMYAKPELRFFVANLSGLKTDDDISYKIFRDDKVIYEGTAKSRPGAAKELRIALFGDIAYSGNGIKELLGRVADEKPNLVMLTGDILQPSGSVSQYLEYFFPNFNYAAKSGVELMSQVVFACCPGDRDLSADKYDAQHDNRMLDATEGGMAYFCLWRQPLNGPGKAAGKNTPLVSGSLARVDDFSSKAGQSYPAAANYSFDWGDSHWLVLDGAAYVDWRDSEWRNWVREDLAASKRLWKFVVIHQPGFSSDTNHGEEQRMRLLCDLFEQGGVDIVFSGHSNSYQRSCPLHFTLAASQDSDRESKLGFVYGKYKLDRNFDGETKNHPDGVIYVVSGGGGAEPLAERRIQDDTTRWQPFTKKFFCASNSFTFLDVNGKELVLKQIADDGKVVDSIKIAK